MPGPLACLMNAADGGNTRVSFSTDSICADMTTVSSFSVIDKPGLNRSELFVFDAANHMGIMETQAYAKLTPALRFYHRAQNESTNPKFCKAEDPEREKLALPRTRTL